MQEEFLISFRARQTARSYTFDVQPGGFRRCAHALDRAFVQRCVTHYSATADVPAVELKLRLDQDQVLCIRTGGPGHSWKHFGDGNERDIDGYEIGGLQNLFRPKIARIRLDLRDSSVLPQAPCHLLRRHVDSVNAARAKLQQAIGEATRGGANIKADFPAHIDSEIVKRTFQFDTSAAGIFRRSSADFNTGVLDDLRAGFFAPLPVYANFSRKDHGLRLFARLGEASFDEQQVEPLFHGFGFG